MAFQTGFQASGAYTPYTGAEAASSAGDYGAYPAKLQPTQTKELYRGNYLDFFASGFQQWSQQFLPDVYEKEIEIYGNRTVSGFLSMLSAEMPFSSDQVIWTEGGRLHARYTGGFFTTAATVPTIATNDLTGSTVATDGHGHITVSFPEDQGGTVQISDLAFRVGQTVLIAVQNSGVESRATSNVVKGVIVAVGTTAANRLTFVASLYEPTKITAAGFTGTSVVTAYVYGSEFQKGSGGMTDAIFPEYNTYQNSPIIMKDHFGINGSDTSQIGWIEVTSENGGSGYLWYVKAEHENRMRWEDYMELSMIESVQAESGTVIAPTTDVSGDISARDNASLRGTEGLFQALERRGNVYDNLSGELAGDGTALNTASTSTGITALGSTFDTILKHLDKQGAIEENMLYINRDLHLAFDNFLAYQNNYGGGNTGGVSWGVFNNSDTMALKLGFSGLRRGSYDFYKTDWRYLNDWTTRGGLGDIEGVMLPAGSSTVYDQNAGVNVKRPFLHIRYRASEVENRKMKSWMTGSVGGAYTNDIDEMRMHYLTERMLITQAANNFFLLTK